jgi:hypothetical protein
MGESEVHTSCCHALGFQLTDTGSFQRIIPFLNILSITFSISYCDSSLLLFHSSKRLEECCSHPIFSFVDNPLFPLRFSARRTLRSAKPQLPYLIQYTINMAAPTFVIESGTDTDFEADTEDEKFTATLTTLKKKQQLAAQNAYQQSFRGPGQTLPKSPPATNTNWGFGDLDGNSAKGKAADAQAAIDKFTQPKSNPKKPAANPNQSIVLPKWTKDKQSLLTQNLNVLMETARKREAATAQRTLVLRSPQGQGVKRQRNATAQRQAAGGRQQKRLRLNPQTQMRGPANVFELPKPIRIPYLPLSAKDRDDEFYTAMFARLQRDIQTFVEDYFIVRDLDAGEGFNPWGLDWSPEFINWAKTVAEDDPACGGWENLMRSSTERKWFLCAIIHRIIHSKIFDADLWGSTTEQGKVMVNMAWAMLDDEGMHKTPNLLFS